MKIAHRAGRWALAAALAGSLGFGATQVMATPSVERGDRDERACSSPACPPSICKCVGGQCVDRVTGAWCFL